MTREEAIRRIKAWNLNPDDMEVLAVVIPELAESEDDRMLRTIIRGFKNWKSHGNLTFNNTKVDDIIAYLEKQKERKPAEWSDEDEEMMADIIDSLEYAYPYDNEFRIAWLKSLRPQPKWKPTEEQIIAVKHAYNCFPNKCSTKSNLKRLYFDLKKLI